MDFRVDGAGELSAMARRVRAAGDRGLSREFRSGLQRAARPAVAAARQGFRDRLPSEGGLNETVAAGRITARVRVSGSSAELVVTAQAGMDLPALDRGRLRHPTHGHRDRWVEQRIRPGALSEPMEEHAPEVFDAVVEAALDMLDKL